MRPQPPSPRTAVLLAQRSLVVCSLLAVLIAVTAAWCLQAAGAAPWRWPLQPRPAVLNRFAPPAQPWGAGRRGVELAAAVDEAVRAPAAGVIVFAGAVAGIPTVSVDHGDLVSTYQPVLATGRRGTSVAAGAVLGTVQALPRLCGAMTCLRWGVYLDGSSPRRYADPLALVGAAPVRLLPPEAPAEPPAATVVVGPQRAAAAAVAAVTMPPVTRARPAVPRVPAPGASRRPGALPTTAVAVALIVGAGLGLPAAGALIGSPTARRGTGRRNRIGIARRDR